MSGMQRRRRRSDCEHPSGEEQTNGWHDGLRETPGGVAPVDRETMVTERTTVVDPEVVRLAPHDLGSEARVCIVNHTLPPDYGGAEIAAYRYAERLSQAGSKVILLGRTEDDRSGQSFPPYVEPVAVSLGGGRRTGGPAPFQAFEVLTRIARRLWPLLIRRRQEYDVLHVFNSRSLFNLLAVPVARALGKPAILEMSLLGSDDPAALRRRSGRVGKLMASRPSIRYLLFRGATACVSKSPALTESYRTAGEPMSKLVEIPYAVDTETYAPASADEKDELRERLGLPLRGAIVLFVGGLSPRKGVHVLLEAFGSTSRRHAECSLVLAGPGAKYAPSYVEGLRATISEHGLTGRVFLLERFVENVHEFMRAADIFSLPSEREGLPISVLEAMACGLAVVASDIPEISGSQIRDGTEGLLVPVGDAPALARALDRLLSGTELRVRLGQAGRRRALERFSEEVVDARYRALYTDVLCAAVERRRWL